MSTLGRNNVVGIMGKAYLQEYSTVGKKLWSKIMNLKDKISNSRTLKLPEKNANLQEKTSINEENGIEKMLQRCTYDEKQVSENYTEKEETIVQEQNLTLEEEE